MENKMSRILFAAPGSGSGKTMITCGFLEVLKRRKLKAVSLKCGPDYIDPMFHRRVLGVPSGNLDTFFTEDEVTRYLLSEKAKEADITVIEGVMGYYDGLGGTSERASTYEIAKVTDTPVILIVDSRGASVSLAAIIRGITEFRKDSHIRGILLNRVSAGYFERLKELIERECGLQVLGYVPQLPGMEVPSRHLGLIAPEEMRSFQNWVGTIADAIEKTVDVDRLIAIAREAGECKGKAPKLPKLPERVRLAVAQDEAFSFYYAENFKLLEQMGAEIVPFSPLHDTKLPDEVDGILLGGGYPENYAGELEAAAGMREAVRQACEMGMPCLAECGGFLYLQKALEGVDKIMRNMAGVLPGKGFYTQKLCRFGYIEARNLTAGVLGEAGGCLKGHEFHYWDCTENGADFWAGKPAGSQSYSCMVHTSTLAAGFPHFYYYSNPEMIYRFLEKCLSCRAGRLAKKHWDSIAKPIDSLGLLEEYVTRLCRIAGSCAPPNLQKRALVIFCADHGVVTEGVTQTGSEVTKVVSENFARGCSTVNYMAKAAGVDIYTIDIGMNTPPYPEKNLVQGAVVDRKISCGSGNIAVEPAMSLQQCRQALDTGIRLVKELKDKGYGILATGEMGIGNTTPTSALSAVFLCRNPQDVTGKGAGLSDEGIKRKRRVVEQVIKRIQDKKLTDPVEILAEAGGYEIAGMAGVFLGGVRYRIPVVLDGAISCVAALAAMKIDCRVADYVIASHVSEEATGQMALEALGVEAVLHGRMCLGEGTGAMAVFPLLDMAVEVYRNMGTFTAYGIEPYTRMDGGI